MEFTKLHFENYKSLKNLTIDLKKNSKGTKKLIAIYGENGAGKTNIIDALKNLCLSLITLEANTEWSNIMAKQSQNNDEESKSPQMNFKKMVFFDNHRNIEKVFKNAHMIGEKENTRIVYDFDIHGRKGTYEFDFSSQNELVKEKLEYVVNKRKGLLFEIKKDVETDNLVEKYNRVLIKNRDLKSDIRKEVKKFWGKHSFLSILNFILSDDNYEKNFLKENISLRLIEIINEFKSFLFYKHSEIETTEKTIKFENVLLDFSVGFLKNTNDSVDKIRNTEDLLNEILPRLSSSISYVKYDIKNINESIIKYELILCKVIGGKNRDIRFIDESDGTKNVIKILPLILGAMAGKVVIIDEIDNGIHDLLMEGIIQEFKDYINGQLIFTTHDTLLMKNLDKGCVYLLNIDANGNKEAYSLDEFSIKNSDGQNKTKQYLEGKFDAIPYIDRINFNYVNKILNRKEE